ncbi:arsenate reductase family protein [Pedobacter sp. SL55]|uniref:arsenate reductase family protein n=1 Tax=Pedobacter sp. SL55 TaxID=2995161 RepID=UPI00226E230E|nr:arsenate reductase family protein [Pedobacter sp. SL55]WAC40861.1 arsenate reductase family protein [Pedobacter sp. SL55]
MSITIYHNSKCSKSNIALKEITQSGEPFEVINYLEDVPSVEELKDVLTKLNLKPFDIVRKTEKVYLEKYKGKELSDEEWVKALHENPILIQRPIIVNGDRAVITRSEEAMDSII